MPDESTWLFGGLLVDEWATSSTFVQNDETDQRSISAEQLVGQRELRALYRVRTSANQAIGLLNKWKPTPASDIARDVFRARIRRAAARVGLLQRHSAERRAGDRSISASRCR